MSAGKILVIEDDADTRANLRDLLEMDGYEADLAATFREGLEDLKRSPYLAIILDQRLPDASPTGLIVRLHAVAIGAAVIVVTGYADLAGAIGALRDGAADYILKPLNPEALRAALHRVAERNRLEVEKRRSENAFRSLLEAAECVILILRPDGSIAYASPFAERLTGLPACDIVGRRVRDVLRPLRGSSVIEDSVQRLAPGSRVQGLQETIVCRDGSHRSMIWNACHIDDYEGSPAAMIVGQDITTLKTAQERALRAERLAAIGQMVTGLAHESRNALQRSQACLEMLELHVQDDPISLDLIGRVQAAQDHLTRLYEDVQGYAAPLRLGCHEADLAAVWRSAWSHLLHHPNHAQATLTERIGCDDLRCSVDAFRLEQVFRNILENALAAGTPPIHIEIACAPDRIDDQPAVRVAVRDNGCGLTPEARSRLFEPFFTTKIKGTGLGMAIVQRIVEAHGGGVSVGPGAGPGAEIILTLPRKSR
jgi:PAS domain S-box-containing protein